MCMTSFTAKKKRSFTLKIVYNKKKLQIFGMNMPFISSCEAINCIISFVALPLIKYAFFASLDEINGR